MMCSLILWIFLFEGGWPNYLSTSLCISAKSDLFSLGVPLWTRIFWIDDFLRHQTKWPFKLEFRVRSWRNLENPELAIQYGCPHYQHQVKAVHCAVSSSSSLSFKILFDLVLYLLYLLFTLFSYNCSFVEHNGLLQWENILTHLSVKGSIKVDFG